MRLYLPARYPGRTTARRHDGALARLDHRGAIGCYSYLVAMGKSVEVRWASSCLILTQADLQRDVSLIRGAPRTSEKHTLCPNLTA